MNISFFCPAYLDAENLGPLMAETVPFLESVAKKYEILIIDDCSPDDTGAVADRLAEKYGNIRVVHHEKILGCGSSIRTGFLEAKHEVILYTDGDNQFYAEDFRPMLERIGEFDAAVGMRVDRADGAARWLQSKVYNFLVRRLYGVPFRDVNCSMKAFRKEWIDKISIESRTGFIDAEIMIKLHRLGARIVQAPVRHKPRAHGEQGGGSWNTIKGTYRDMLAFRAKI